MEISPAILEFKPPFTKTSTEVITLVNTTDQNLAFKVKTTAPKLYCVRPNASTISPKQKLEVQIILQGLKQEPDANYKCKDKFLVVSLPCPYELNETTQPVAQLWPTLEKQFKNESVSKKIRVLFKTSKSAESSAGDSATVPPAIAGGGAAVAAVASKAKKPNELENTPVLSKSLPDETTINDSIYSTSSSPVAKKQVVDKDLAESQKKINEINDKLNSNKDSAEIPATKVSQEVTSKGQPSGIPMPIAIIGAIIAFILAWLLF